MRVCAREHACACVCVCAYVCVCVCARARACVRACVRTCVYVRACVRVLQNTYLTASWTGAAQSACGESGYVKGIVLRFQVCLSCVCARRVCGWQGVYEVDGGTTSCGGLCISVHVICRGGEGVQAKSNGAAGREARAAGALPALATSCLPGVRERRLTSCGGHGGLVAPATGTRHHAVAHKGSLPPAHVCARVLLGSMLRGSMHGCRLTARGGGGFR